MDHTNDETKSLYTIRIASELSGVSAGTIREYERQGLLRVYRGPSSRHRLFSALEIKWIQQIWHLIHEEGLNIEGIRRLLMVEPCHKIARCPKELREECPVYIEESQPCWASEKTPLCCEQTGRICQSCPVYSRSQKSPALVPKT